jgi:hypothetical protein
MRHLDLGAEFVDNTATLVLFGVFRGKIKKVKIITKKIKHKPLFLTQKALYKQFSAFNSK